jgi:hypothetical protein
VVAVRNPGGLAVPFDLVLEYADGTSERVHRTPAVWQADGRRTDGPVAGDKALRAVTIDTGIFMDANPGDNAWVAHKPAGHRAGEGLAPSHGGGPAVTAPAGPPSGPRPSARGRCPDGTGLRSSAVSSPRHARSARQHSWGDPVQTSDHSLVVDRETSAHSFHIVPRAFDRAHGRSRGTRRRAGGALCALVPAPPTSPKSVSPGAGGTCGPGRARPKGR